MIISTPRKAVSKVAPVEIKTSVRAPVGTGMSSLSLSLPILSPEAQTTKERPKEGQYEVYRLNNQVVGFPEEEPDISRMSINTLDMDLSEVCNLACSYCFKGDLNGRKMTLKTAKQAIRFLVRYSGAARDLHISILGGEPMLSFDLLKQWLPFAHNYCQQRGKRFTVGITTNGTVFTEKHQAFFRKYHIGIHLSIDGIPDVQDQERVFKRSGGGSSAKLEANIPRILAAWPVTHARSTVVPATVDRLAESYRYFCETGFLKVAFALAVCDEWDDDVALRTLEEQYRKVLEYHWEHMKTGDRYFLLSTVEDYIKKTERPDPNWGETICGAGRGLLHVDVEGLLWPCHRFNSGIGPHENLVMGSIYGGFNNDLRDCFLDMNPKADMRTACGKCPASGFCHTPCIAANWQVNGDIYDAGKGFCRATRVLHDVHREHIEKKERDEPDRFKRLVDWVMHYQW